jgi:CHAT domain-containing protein
MNKLSKLLFLCTIALIILFQQPKVIVANTPHFIEREAQDLYQQSQYLETIDLLNKTISNNRATEDYTANAIAYSNLALAYQKLGSWQQAFEALEQAEAMIVKVENEATKNQLQAKVLEVKGQIYLSLGRSQTALETWKQATNIYEQQDNLLGYTQAKIYQTSALQALGLYSQAIKNLTEIQDKLATKPDTSIKVQAALNLGNILTRIGKYEQAATILKSSLAIASQLTEHDLLADILLKLGNNLRLQSQPELALRYYRRAIAIAQKAHNSEIQLSAKLARLEILISSQKTQAVLQEVREIKQILNQLPSQQTTIQAKVILARNLLQLKNQNSQIVAILIQAIQEAKKLKIARIESEALGILGHLYEQNQQLSAAETITEKALLIAQNINASELTYQWQWQLGRILKAQGDTEKAILAYTQATNNLQTLRSDLVAISSNLQYSFRQKIEPVYRELAALLLQPTARQTTASQSNLNQARQVIEALQVAELDNFFRDACLDTQPAGVDNIDTTAAIFYTIIINNRLEVIAAIPDRPLKHYSNELPPSEIEIVVTSINSQISNPRRLNLQLLQQTYDWLIRPVETDLVTNKIKTLVFVPDGILRNLPPAILHDGQHYLIENYSIAIAPSLQLPQLQPTVEKRQEILLAGISKSRQGFSDLPGVKQEIQQIQPLFTSEVLLDNTFTELNFNRSVNKTPFRVVHLATHGQFSSNAEDTFVLTWDRRINIEELNSLIRGDSKQLRPVDLLVLSACETATGDLNSPLGLAGIAVRGGARSTLASLWSVSDRSTVDLMTTFYQELANSNITKAEALRRAQISLLKSDLYSHPFFWSAFILVGNWQ